MPDIYRVYLAVEPTQTHIIFPAVLRHTLEKWFNEVAMKAGYTSAQVRYSDTKPPVLDEELLIYFVYDSSWSLLKFKKVAKAAPDLGEQFGKIGGKSCCEVYVKGHSEKELAVLAFHEAMHDKLDDTSDKLHKLLPKDGGGGLADAALTPDMVPTAANIDLMAKNLRTKLPQWTEGYSVFADAAYP